MSHAALDIFGNVLMTKVRDEAIVHWRKIVRGEMKGEEAPRHREMFECFSDEQRQMFLTLLPEVVDTVLHYLLWTLEQERNVRIAVSTNREHVASLADVSDGLAGELYTEEGWIARFSKED